MKEKIKMIIQTIDDGSKTRPCDLLEGLGLTEMMIDYLVASYLYVRATNKIVTHEAYLKFVEKERRYMREYGIRDSLKVKCAELFERTGDYRPLKACRKYTDIDMEKLPLFALLWYIIAKSDEMPLIFNAIEDGAR